MKLSTASNNKIGRKFFVLFLWLMVWQLVYMIVGKDILVPSPFKTMIGLIELLRQPNFYSDVGVTFYRVFMGIFLSFGLGLLTAVAAYFMEWIREILEPLIRVLTSTPVMAIIILALLWFTKNNVPIFVCFLMCYPVAYTNILKGLQEVDKGLLEMSLVFKVKRSYILKDLYLPQTRPYIEAALGMIIGLSWKAVIAAEVLAVPMYSMGYNLMSAKSYLETDILFAWVIIIVVLSSLCERAAKSFMKREGASK